MVGPLKRKNRVPDEYRITCPGGAHTRELVLFLDGNRVTLQIEERDGGAEITLGMDQLALALVHMQRMYAALIEEGALR